MEGWSDLVIASCAVVMTLSFTVVLMTLFLAAVYMIYKFVRG